ncbi:energy transducer TonB [Pseudochelatococcus sp. G4_1912]|uniref:energy transducer TonB n=1 Tax=Pseudochelatococcus sp. G4_1912 TaxID=3114288 RepID=UPI0039C60608
MSRIYKVALRLRWSASFGFACLIVLGATLGPYAQTVPKVNAVSPPGDNFIPPRPYAGDVMRHWPAYPNEARAAGQEGTVLVKLKVTATGAPEDISIARSSSVVSLDLAAIMAISHWHFEPASRNGKPTEAMVTLPIRFSLSDTHPQPAQ